VALCEGKERYTEQNGVLAVLFCFCAFKCYEELPSSCSVFLAYPVVGYLNFGMRLPGL